MGCGQEKLGPIILLPLWAIKLGSLAQTVFWKGFSPSQCGAVLYAHGHTVECVCVFVWERETVKEKRGRATLRKRSGFHVN